MSHNELHITATRRNPRLPVTLAATLILAALGASADVGGVSFDFKELSARRFAAAFDPQRNVLKEPIAGTATNTFTKTLPLPTTNGGLWRVSARYKMRHTQPGSALFRVSPGPVRPFNILENGTDWGELSVLAEVPPGTPSLKASFIFARGSSVTFDYKDLSLVDETPRAPVMFKEMPMGNLDGRFAVAAGRCGMLEYFWRKTAAAPKNIKHQNLRFELTLPPGIEHVDSSFADKATIKTEKNPDGSSVTTFARGPGLYLRDIFNYDAIRIIVRATGKPGAGGKGQLKVKYADKADAFEVAADPVDFFVIAPVSAQKPTRYCNGVMTGRMFSNLSAAAVEGLSQMMTDAGVTWLVARDSAETYALWRKLGVKYITPSAWQFNNGFQIGNGPKLPESDRYVAVNVNPNDRHAQSILHGTCPISVYEQSDFFRTNTIPFIQSFVKGTDGCWSNWEPYMFNRKGCMCLKCCRAFAKYIGKPYEEIAAKWPKCVMAGGEYFMDVLKFRSLEHAKVVKTLDRVVREATGGDASLGFIPAIAWIEMGSWWRPRNYAAEVQAIDYAGALRWMNPWGPYVAWESNHPYIYTKRKPLCHFFAAQDVRRTVNSDYPAGARPKLMALPQGYQCGHWLSQPEHISMALDSYFFNGWESTIEYYFPRGYDARYWNAFAEATDRAAKFERFVLDGKRADAAVSVTPFPGVYAANVRMLSGYLPEYRDLSPLQSVSYDLGESRIVAVLNFWQKGEAFFTLKAKGLKPGRYQIVKEDSTLRVPGNGKAFYTAEELASTGVKLSVGAARTRVFEIRPIGSRVTSDRTETDAAFDARFNARRAELERNAADDAEYERSNGDVVYDSMPVI